MNAKLIKESKVMSYDEFKKIVKKEFTKDEIEGFGKTDNGYGVYVIAYGEKEIEIMCNDLRQYDLNVKWWHSSDPEDDEPIYFIEAIPIMNESKKSARKSIKESNLPNKVYDVLNELVSNFLLDYNEFVEFERNGLEHHFDKIRELGAKLRKADMKGNDALYQKIVNEIVTVVKRANGTLNESRKSIKEASDDDITVKEFCFWGYSGNTVEIWTTDGVLCDSFEVRNVGKSEYKNYEIHGWDCVKNTVIIYIKK